MRYWILGILLVLLPSCRKGEVPATTPPEQPDTGDTGVEVRFSAGVTASAEELTSVSRAPLKSIFQEVHRLVCLVFLLLFVRQVIIR